MSRDVMTYSVSRSYGWGVKHSQEAWGSSIRGNVRTPHGIVFVSCSHFTRHNFRRGYIEFIQNGIAFDLQINGRGKLTRTGLVRMATRFVRDLVADGQVSS